jgi:RNA polymerase sigma-70 factor (sigma-E family)
VPEDRTHRAAPGWEGEFSTYFEARAPALRSTAFVLCGDWHRADDIVQNTFLKLYVIWPRLSRHDELDAFARRVMFRLFLRENRRLWRSREQVSGELPEPEGFSDSDVAQRLTVRAALAGVPPKQRAVLVLRYWSDLSVEDAAVALGCSPGTVKSQSARGLVALRKQLGPHFDDLFRNEEKEHRT